MKSNINVQDMMKELFGNSCCGYCYAYLGEVKRNINPDIHTLTTDFLNGWNKGYVDNDGFISKPIQYLKSVGINIRDIRKPSITKLSELPEGLWTVEYKNPNGGSHFCVISKIKNKIKCEFDPSGDSISRKNGEVISYREFIYDK